MSINKLFLEKLEWAGLACHSSLACAQPPALVLFKKNDEKVEYSWFEYKEKTLQAMEGLKARNLKAGESVVIIPLNLPESFFILLGAILMGAVPVPLNVMLLKEPGQKDLINILNDCQPKLIVSHTCLKSLLPEYCSLRPEFGLSMEQILAEGKKALAGQPAGKNNHPSPRRLEIPVSERNSQEVLIMPYTSGTEGELKGVMLSEKGVISSVSAAVKKLRITRQERMPSYMSMGHITELVATFFGQLYSGYTVYFTEEIEELIWNRDKFKEEVIPKFLKQVQPTVFPGAPKVYNGFRQKIQQRTRRIPVFVKNNRIFKKMLVNYLGFGSTRLFISAGSPIETAELNFFQSLGITIDDIYGQTETCGPILLNGFPIGQEVGVSIGPWNQEIMITTPSLMLGYYHNPKATLGKIREIRELNDSGSQEKKVKVFYSGDAGVKGEKGQIIFAGRLGDGGKGGNGEYYRATKLYGLENEVKKIAGVEEVIFIFEGKPHLSALVFHDPNIHPFTKTHLEIQKRLPQIGEGMYKIKSFRLLDKKELIFTPTLKIKKGAVIARWQEVINKMYEDSH